jgi:hypothetical protein
VPPPFEGSLALDTQTVESTCSNTVAIASRSSLRLVFGPLGIKNWGHGDIPCELPPRKLDMSFQAQTKLQDRGRKTIDRSYLLGSVGDFGSSE